MNELKSLEKTKIVWSYLRDNPKSTKLGAYIELGLTEDIADCALCEYSHSECKICPLKSFWEESVDGDHHTLSNLDITYPCQYSGTPYNNWEFVDTDDIRSDDIRSDCANQIVEACDAKIASIHAARGFLSKIYNKILARLFKKS